MEGTTGTAGDATAWQSTVGEAELTEQIRKLVREEVRRLSGGGAPGQRSPTGAPQRESGRAAGASGGSGPFAPAGSPPASAPASAQSQGKARLPLGTAALRAAERKIHERLSRNLKELQAVLRETEAIAREMETLLARTPQPDGSKPGTSAGRSPGGTSGSQSQGAS